MTLEIDDHALQVPWVIGQTLDTVSTDNHGVGMTEPGQTGDVDPRLDGQNHHFLDDVAAALIDEWPLVPLEADAVTGVVTPKLRHAQVGEGSADLSFDLGQPTTRSDGIERGLLELEHAIEVVLELRRWLADDHRPLELRVIASDVRTGPSDEHIPPLQSPGVQQTVRLHRVCTGAEDHHRRRAKTRRQRSVGWTKGGDHRAAGLGGGFHPDLHGIAPEDKFLLHQAVGQVSPDAALFDERQLRLTLDRA